MTNPVKNSSKLAALLKKTAQKLVKNPKSIHKELKKLALTLPLMALLVEEVRAAQKKVTIDAMAVTGDVFEDEATLAEFVDAQNLEPAQYTEIQAELEGVLLAKADLAKADTPEVGGDRISNEQSFGHSGTSLQTEDRAAVLLPEADAPFTPAGLPAALGGFLGIGAGPVVGTVVGAAVVLNSFDTTTQAPTTAQAEGTHLTTSLKDLQKLGVDFVTPADGQSTIHVALGAGDAFGTTTGIPLFGDTNRDGSINAAEDAALNVNLTITSASQLTEVASLGNLSSFGIDSVQFDLQNQALLDALLSHNTLAGELATIRVNGLSVDNIDMASNAATITDSQAVALSTNHLHFAADDTITLQASAGSTHLSTSLKDLQKLGVDAVAVIGAAQGANLSLALGEGAAVSLANGALPSFGADSALNVTLDVNSVSQLAEVASLAGNTNVDLATLGIDNVQLNLAGQTQLDALLAADVGSNAALDQNLSAVRNEGLDITTIDMVTTDVVHLTDTQASALLQDMLHFASNDNISVEASHTHLSTSLKDLQKLGVDSVTTSAIVEAGHKMVVDYGATGALSLTDALPKFGDTTALDVTLSTHSLSELNELLHLVDATTQNHLNLEALGIDHIELRIANTTSIASILSNGVDVFGLGLSVNDTWGTLIHTLHDAGLGHVQVEPTAHVTVNDDLTAALYDAGMLHALPNAAVVIDTGEHMVLNTSLKAMAELGVDQVVSAQSVQKLYVGLGDNPDVAAIMAGFTDGSVALAHGGLFGKDAALVVDQTTFDHFGQLGAAAISDLLGKLSSLGFTEIDVLKGATDTESHHIDVVAQTPVLSSTVQILGAPDAHALLDVFGTDILDKKIS